MMEQLVVINRKTPPQDKITFEEFLAWADEDTDAEWEDGKAEFYRLGGDRYYHLSLPDAEGIYHSQSLNGFWLKVDSLWQDPLPDELEILRQLGVLSQ